MAAQCHGSGTSAKWLDADAVPVHGGEAASKAGKSPADFVS